MELVANVNWDTLKRLVPICQKYVGMMANGEDVDVLNVAADLEKEFKLRERVQHEVNSLIEQGFEDLGPSASALVPILQDMAQHVMKAVYSYLEDGDANALFNSLDDILLGNANQLQTQLVDMLDVPDDVASFIGEKLGRYALSVYLFAAAYQIYAQAAREAELARQHRAEVEQSVRAALDELEKSRGSLGAFLSDYMLDRLLPFENAVEAMDAAVLEGDDDGYIKANAELWKLFGHTAQYTSKEGFDALMASDDSFVL